MHDGYGDECVGAGWLGYEADYGNMRVWISDFLQSSQDLESLISNRLAFCGGLSACQPVCLSACLPVSLSVCDLSVCDLSVSAVLFFPSVSQLSLARAKSKPLCMTET